MWCGDSEYRISELTYLGESRSMLKDVSFALKKGETLESLVRLVQEKQPSSLRTGLVRFNMLMGYLCFKMVKSQKEGHIGVDGNGRLV